MSCGWVGYIEKRRTRGKDVDYYVSYVFELRLQELASVEVKKRRAVAARCQELEALNSEANGVRIYYKKSDPY